MSEKRDLVQEAHDRHQAEVLMDTTAPAPLRVETHVFLVGVTVMGGTREEAERYLHTRLPYPGRRGDESLMVVEWWVAEDERHDGSDNDSAVFVPRGSQEHASGVLRR